MKNNLSIDERLKAQELDLKRFLDPYCELSSEDEALLDRYYFDKYQWFADGQRVSYEESWRIK